MNLGQKMHIKGITTALLLIIHQKREKGIWAWGMEGRPTKGFGLILFIKLALTYFQLIYDNNNSWLFFFQNDLFKHYHCNYCCRHYVESPLWLLDLHE